MSRFFKALEQAERDGLMGKHHELRHDDREESPLTSPDLSTASVMTLPGRPAVSPSAEIWDAPARPIPQVRAATSPLVEDRSVDSIDVHLVSLLAPTSFAAERYRGLRHAVEQLRKKASVSIIGVSSPDVKDGKTTAAINLAGALAQAPGARVIVVDADLRRPSVATQLGLGMVRLGLTDAIDDPTLSLEDVVTIRRPFNLAVLPVGRMPVDPYEALKSPRFGQILEQTRGRYDYVVVDCPPLLHVPDCRIIDEFVDAFLLVVTAHKTPRQLAKDALTIVTPAKVVGVIFNRDDGHIRNDGYYYRSPSRQLEPLRAQLRNWHHALPASAGRLVSRMLHPDPRTRPVNLTFVLNELRYALGHVQAKMAATSIGSSVRSAALSPALRSWTRRWALVGLATLVAGGVLLTWPDVVNIPRIPVRSTVDVARPAMPAPINPSLRGTADQDASTAESGLDPSADSPAPAATPLPYVPLPPSGGTPAPAGSTPSTLPSPAKREGAAMTAEPKVGAPAVSPIAEPPRTPPTGKGPAARRAPLRPETETASAKIAPTPSPQPESPVPPPPGRPIQPPPDNPRAADPADIIEWLVRESPRQWRNGGPGG